MNLFWQYSQFEDLKNFSSKIEEYVSTFKLGVTNDIDTVVGYDLDILGKIIGIDRRPIVVLQEGALYGTDKWGTGKYGGAIQEAETQYISDDNFRKILQARSKQLLEPRTLNNLLETITEILPNMIFTYDTSTVFEITIEYQLSSIDVEEEAIMEGGYFLTSQGCELIINGV